MRKRIAGTALAMTLALSPAVALAQTESPGGENTGEDVTREVRENADDFPWGLLGLLGLAGLAGLKRRDDRRTYETPGTRTTATR